MPGPIDKAKLVTITASSQKAAIFYTDDGSEPTRKSRKYEAPIHIAPGTTLKARVYLSGWRDSDIQTGVYEHPSATTTTAPAGGDATPAPTEATTQQE